MGESGPGDHDDGRQRQLAARSAGLVGGRWHSGRTALDQVRKVAAWEGCMQRCIVMSGAGRSMHGTRARARAGGLRGACGHGLRSRDSV